MLGLFTGARAGELLQLLLLDVKEEQGIYYLDLINDNSSDGSGQKQIKSDAGRRAIPLHPTLVQLGFVDYCSSIPKSKKRVFHDIYAPDGRAAKQYSRSFGDTLKALNAKTPKTSFHSFRHNFKDALSRAGIYGPPVKALMGHAVEGVNDATYGSELTVQMLHQYIAKIEYDIDLNHLL
jgi:Phage integrase family.